MTDAYAMAAVTAVLRMRLRRHLVRAQVSNVLGNVDVSAVPPDTLFPQGVEEKTQLNLYLHGVSPNTGWWNEGLPVRNRAGERVSAPPLALDLHYVLTAFGKAAYHAEILLGHAMQCLHEEPVLTRGMIEATLSPNPPDPSIPSELADAGLAQQIELVKLAPERLSTEESSKFWSALQASYRLSTGYLASVVLIDTTASAKTALPVSTRGVTSSVLQSPRITSVESEDGELVPIEASSTIVVRGERLRGEGVTVVLGEIEYTPPAQDVEEDAIRVPLPSLATAPRAGSRGVQVIHAEDLGEPPVPHRAYGSNVGAFLLRPSLTLGTKTQATQTIGGVDYVTGTFQIHLDPPVAVDQRVFLVLNELGTPAGRAARSYRFGAPKKNGITGTATETSTIVFPFENVVAGTYLVRVQVDGALSTLAASSGVYDAPQEAFG